MLIDSHAHLTFKDFDPDLEEVIRRSLDCGTQIINASADYETSVQAVDLAQNRDGMWAFIGCHPDELANEEFNIDKYRKLALSSKKVVGIGEVGLDYYRLDNNAAEIKSEQKEIFLQFINLAQELDLPLVLHGRGKKDDPYGVYDEMLEILKAEVSAYAKASADRRSMKSEVKGVIHCYGGNLEQVKKFIDLGFYIGITGIVTFKNAKELQAIVKEISLDKMLIETDAPFLAPDPYRGQRNEPSYVKYVCQKIAELKELSFDEVAKATHENTCRLFNLK
ncbi:MAG: TatD family hydrolase [Candidatus Parcubacteria bacterium]|nr:TatD family hydrolase [Candidatus Parcubacteria bacterium]